MIPRILNRTITVLSATLLMALLRPALAAGPVTIVALGDSLTAGYGLAESDSFPVKLEAALKSRGLAVTVVNAGVSGDTAEEGLARLDWSVPEGTDAVIVELGANNALRGMDPSGAKAALDEIVAKLKARKIEVLIAGMEAPSSLGDSYVTAFRAMYSELAGKHGALLYPFFLDGVATDPQLNQPDGLHPTGKGVDVIVGRILPKVEELIARVAAAKAG